MKSEVLHCKLKDCAYCRPGYPSRQGYSDAEIKKWWLTIKNKSGISIVGHNELPKTQWKGRHTAWKQRTDI